jgi:hypothetical protein
VTMIRVLRWHFDEIWGETCFVRRPEPWKFDHPVIKI